MIPSTLQAMQQNGMFMILTLLATNQLLPYDLKFCPMIAFPIVARAAAITKGEKEISSSANSLLDQKIKNSEFPTPRAPTEK